MSDEAALLPDTPTRLIRRNVHEAARDVARQIATTEHYQHSRHERKKVEMLFAHLKHILKLRRLRLRGLTVPAMSSPWQQQFRTYAV